MRHFECVASHELHCNLVVGRAVFKTPDIPLRRLRWNALLITVQSSSHLAALFSWKVDIVDLKKFRFTHANWMESRPDATATIAEYYQVRSIFHTSCHSSTRHSHFVHQSRANIYNSIIKKVIIRGNWKEKEFFISTLRKMFGWKWTNRKILIISIRILIISSTRISIDFTR